MTLLSDLKQEVNLKGLKRNQDNLQDTAIDIVNWLVARYNTDPDAKKVIAVIYNTMPERFRTNNEPSPSRVQQWINQASDQEIKVVLQALKDSDVAKQTGFHL
jgi:hypothetical protein